MPSFPAATVEACVRIAAERAAAGEVALAAGNDPTLPRLLGDEVRIKQVVLNLLSNAIKFTPSGGRVTAGFRCTDGCLVLAVRDTGIGIAAEDIPGLTAPFRQLQNDHTRAEPGSRLGLYLCESLAAQHGATLEIDSAPCQGTRVAVRFPLIRSVT